MVEPNNERKDTSMAIERAIVLVSNAVDLLDAHADCPEASAHLDMALRRLREHYDRNEAPRKRPK